jgi:MYND finger
MSVIIQDARDGGFMEESKSEERREELKKFLQCIKGNRKLGNALCAVRTRCYTEEGETSFEMTESVMNLFRKMLERIFSGEQEVNGKKGHWSNGCFGSRWYDDRNTYTTCRVAFYSRKTSSEWNCDKAYMLDFTFEPREANYCGNYDECRNKGHGYKKCSACETTRYCSVECQKKHWKTHKPECKEYQEEQDEE